ncbi:MAG: glycoside hydrolase family 3 N-terminal domain-containing protein [Bacteroidota bacterium]
MRNLLNRSCVAFFFFLACIHFAIAQEPTPSSLDHMIGQMIMIGVGDFNEADVGEPIFADIAAGKAGGVVLYEKNIRKRKSKKALADLVGALQSQAMVPLFVSIDEEGGWVTRLKSKYGFPENVSAQYLGDLDELDSTRFYALQTAQLLDSLGINMNYAPVVDINSNPANPVVGKIERSFSADPAKVIAHAEVVVESHQKMKIASVLKHFPGHGSSTTDTHLGLTDVTETWQLDELYPYVALIDSGKVDAIMTAHIVNKFLDQHERPATLSYTVIGTLLRDYLKYQGVVISDDMQMGAIDNEYGLREAIRLSVLAGVDILMFANNVSDENLISASKVHDILKALVADGSIEYDRIVLSYNRISELKKKLGLLDEEYSEMLKQKLSVFE